MTETPTAGALARRLLAALVGCAVRLGYVVALLRRGAPARCCDPTCDDCANGGAR